MVILPSSQRKKNIQFTAAINHLKKNKEVQLMPVFGDIKTDFSVKALIFTVETTRRLQPELITNTVSKTMLLSNHA